MFLSVTLFVLFLMLESSSSPFKISLMLAFVSTMCSAFLYFKSSSIFLCCSLVISFSSGMMILFSYCSMFSSCEYKNKAKLNLSPLILSLLMLSMLMVPQTTLFSSMEKLCSMVSVCLYMVFLMFIVIISMSAMNISFFNPTKKLMQSY
uniref:NADH dehydrogenase subunit 6 n=1 Tax=Psoroptes ovis TaxID=83912 RepID=A0A075X8K1_PSOOV|nr:NADH dehydrogenase subunit 6 [Psoroptes ovis]AIH15205.1 NADH dehydrogenase subunit 6 [Psoroptes ovis]